MQIYVAIGSNFERHKNIVQALSMLQTTFGELQISNVYETIALGQSGENYYNTVVGFLADDDVESIHSTLKSIEFELGRKATDRHTNRVVIDLDLLSFGEDVIENEQYSLPRRDIIHCAFVLKPLSDIAPDTAHPVSGEAYATLWARFADKSSIVRDVSHLFR